MALSTRQESVRAELAEAGEQLMAARVDRDRHALRLQQLAPNHSQQAFPPAAPPAAAAGPPGAAKEVSAGDGYRSYSITNAVRRCQPSCGLLLQW